jgi:serine/threonine-protein kinase
MATVYLAHDVRHDREVAIKVLRPDLAALLGADRFLSEIKTTAKLNHPHIVPLFDSGEADGFLFYVMPVVSGESLRDRLKRERHLSVAEAVRITDAVAGALDYAHRSGVIHRDIKPANILLHDGQPLIADFGIALAVRTAGGDRLTETGLSLGTPDYMSPEQASGERTVDGRSDVFSLACVTYEMLAGQPPFSAPTAAATVSRVLTQNPEPLTERRASVPLHVAGAVRRALEKLPADRFDTAGAFGNALSDETFRWPATEQSIARRPQSRWLIAAATLLAVTAGISLWLALQRSTAPAPSVVRLALTLPEDQSLPVGPVHSVLELSPDGTQLVYVGHQGHDRQLFLRPIGDFESRALPGTRGAAEPFFSPDGRWVGFFAEGKLKKTSVSGGIPVDIADAPGAPFGGSWGDDGTILYSLSGSSLWRVSSDGGTPRELAIALPGHSSEWAKSDSARGILAPLRWPRMLPGSTHALVTPGWPEQQRRDSNAGFIGVVELSTGKFTPLFVGSRPFYVETGHIVFDAGRENIKVIPFSLDRLRTTGPAVPLADNALRSPGAGTNFGVAARSGAVAYPTGGFNRRLVIVARNGRETPLDITPRGYRYPSASRDGRFAAVTVDPQPPQIWVIDLQRQGATPVAADGYNLYAAWEPGGNRIAFQRQEGGANVYQIQWPDTGAPTLILPSHAAPRWARRGQLFVTPEDASNILIYDIASQATRTVTATPASEHSPALSPDGNWIAYASNIGGGDEIYVMPYGGGSPRAVSNGGGTEPRWAPDGSELYFRRGNTIAAVKVRTSPTFEITSAVEPLFTEMYDFTNDDNWDVLPNGRFLMVKGGPNQGREIRFVLNGIR